MNGSGKITDYQVGLLIYLNTDDSMPNPIVYNLTAETSVTNSSAKTIQDSKNLLFSEFSTGNSYITLPAMGFNPFDPNGPGPYGIALRVWKPAGTHSIALGETSIKVTPIPEPSTLLGGLSAIGVSGGLMMWRRRRKA